MYTVDSLHPSTILKKAEGGSSCVSMALGSGASTDNDAPPARAHQPSLVVNSHYHTRYLYILYMEGGSTDAPRAPTLHIYKGTLS